MIKSIKNTIVIAAMVVLVLAAPAHVEAKDAACLTYDKQVVLSGAMSRVGSTLDVRRPEREAGRNVGNVIDRPAHSWITRRSPTSAKTAGVGSNKSVCAIC